MTFTATGPGLSVDTRKSARLGLPDQIPELAGFRAVAVLMVLLHHVFFGWKQTAQAFEGIPRPVLSLLEKGWTGVDLFFVLSGLLITGILIDSKSNSRYFRNFYARRVLRIVPVYFTVITLSWIILYQDSAKYFLLSFGFLANFSGAFGIETPHGPGVFWSLSIEEHFYLAWPLLIWFATRRQLIVAAMGIIVLSPLLRGYCYSNGMDPENQIYLYSWFRLDGLATGALLAIWLRSPLCNSRSILWVSGGIFLAFVLLTVGGYPHGLLGTKTLASTSLRYTQMNWLFASAILASLALHGSRWTSPLRWRFMQVTSDLSYCMYLVHLIVGDAYLMLLQSLDFVPTQLLSAAQAFWLQSAVIVGITYGLAALSRRFLEVPFLRLKRHFE